MPLPNTPKLAYIDSLRAIAIVLVILLHTGIDYPPGRASFLWPVIHNGMYGVQLFYVVSAFTLFLSHNRRNTEQSAKTRNFFIRRFFRIAPMYYLAILYYLWQNGLGSRGQWMSGESHITTIMILSNIFFVHELNPNWINTVVPGGWSIATEMAFYLLLPCLTRFIQTSQQAIIFSLVTLVVQSLLHHLLVPLQPIPSTWLWQQYLYLYLPSQLPVFGLGILMYFLIYPTTHPSSKVSAQLYLLVSFLWLLTLLPSKNGLLPAHILFGVCFMLLALALSQYPVGLIVNPVLGYVGRISYSMYLTHFAVIYWIDYYAGMDLIPSTWSAVISFSIRFVWVVLLTIVISSLFHWLVELPGQTVGRVIIHRLPVNSFSIALAGLKKGMSRNE